MQWKCGSQKQFIVTTCSILCAILWMGKNRFASFLCYCFRFCLKKWIPFCRECVSISFYRFSIGVMRKGNVEIYVINKRYKSTYRNAMTYKETVAFCLQAQKHVRAPDNKTIKALAIILHLLKLYKHPKTLSAQCSQIVHVTLAMVHICCKHIQLANVTLNFPFRTKALWERPTQF